MTAHLLSLVDRLATILRAEEARKLARAVRATQARHRDGYMAHATMKSHVESLLGQARAAGLMDGVNNILNEVR